MLVKLLDARDVYEAKGPDAALRYLAKLPKVCGAGKDAIGRGAAALIKPDFYRQLGQDPAALHAAGLDAVRRLLYPSDGESTMSDANAVIDAPAPKAAKTKKAKTTTVQKAIAASAPNGKPKAGGKAAKTQKKATAGGTVRGRVFALLAKSPDGLTGAEVKSGLGLAGVPSLLKDEGLSDKPRIRRQANPDGRGVLYSLTAAGRKDLEVGKVDENAAPSAARKEWPSNK